MGVLGDDDIEKLNESFKKRRIAKIFHDPKKAYDFWDLSVSICAVVIAFLGITVFAYSQFYDSLSDSYEKVIDMGVKQGKQVDAQRTLIIDNADCPSLFAMYSAAKTNPDLDYTKELIKDEIVFRC